MKKSRLIFRIGTRGSALALAQSAGIQRQLKKSFPRRSFPLCVIRTQGDEFQSVEQFKKNAVGVFTKAIERALLKKEVDIAIHSLKDLPTDQPKGLCLAAVPKRLDASDALISRGRYSLRTLPQRARVGTGSPRRKRQLNLLRPDLRLVDIRGNLDTRIGKVIQKRELDAVIVARAGLLRLKKYLRYAAPIDPKVLLPAVGQAALGLQARTRDAVTLAMLRRLNDSASEKKALAERSFLKRLQGGCRVPVGIYCEIKQGVFHMRASVFSVISSSFVSGEIKGRVSQAQALAKRLAEQLLKNGAGKFLKEARP